MTTAAIVKDGPVFGEASDGLFANVCEERRADAVLHTRSRVVAARV